MDLYYVMTNYHVLCAILHRIVFNRENKAVLWVSSYLIDNQPEVFKALKRSTFFDEVVAYQEIGFLYFGDMKINRKMINEELENINENMDSKRVKELRTFKNLYICQDTHSLGIYLNEHGIKYNFFEDGCGILSNKELLLSLVKKFPAVYKIVHELQCVGESPNVIHRYGDLSEQAEGYYNEKDVDFSVKKILSELDDDDMEKIFEIYNCKRYDFGNKKKILLLTWKYNSAGLMTLEEQRMFFATLLDYFEIEDATLFIKPHPFDMQPDYKSWFKDAIVLERYMPSELLPFLIEGKFDRGITNWSTSILGLRDILKDIVNFDKDIDYTYKDFHKYFAIIKYLDKIKNKKSVKKLVLNGINEKQFLQLIKHHIKNYEEYFQFASGGDGIYILGKYNKNFENKKCIILNGCENFIPQEIIGIKAKDKKECVYLYNLSSEGLFVEKDMKYSGYKLLIAPRGVSEYINYLDDELVKKNDEFEEYKQKKQEKIEELKGKVRNYKRQRDILRDEVDGMLASSSWKITKPLRKMNSMRIKNDKRRN